MEKGKLRDILVLFMKYVAKLYLARIAFYDKTSETDSLTEKWGKI